MGNSSRKADGPPAEAPQQQGEGRKGSTTTQLGMWREATGGTGSVADAKTMTLKQFCEWATTSGLLATRESAEQVFEALDADHNGTLDFEEFARLSEAMPRPADVVLLMYDKDGDGVITSEEVQHFVRSQSSQWKSEAEVTRASLSLMARVREVSGDLNAAAESSLNRESIERALERDPSLFDEFLSGNILMEKRRVLVELFRAQGLSGRDPLVHCCVRFDGRDASQTSRSAHPHNTSEPRFNNVMVLAVEDDANVAPQPLSLFVQVFNRTRTAPKPTPICQVTIPASSWPIENRWVPLEPANSGEILLSVRELGAGEVVSIVGCPFAVHHCKSGGKHSVSDFALISVRLAHVLDVYGDEFVGWNQNYAKAKQIFGPGIQSSALRSIIRASHRSLYGVGVKRTETGRLRTAAEFLELFDDSGVRYTYVLGADSRLRFSLTGTSFIRDFSSKHAIHSGCADAVRVAGEMFVFDNTLHIDNGSGTYGPPVTAVEKLARVLQANFPDLRVEVHDFQDIKELRTSLKLEN